ncbi:hypothetical protein AVEN_250406-1 [Araneus ventricosus]|uniref:Uncharacterized protein n=1 Tax=Araneus ventricosus TaxID=182803 RepID=A0A4Y2R7B5_ARAVE|nr:hypothetical protein AVEN_250406-1 [Araneus ventricosus]
MQRLEELTDLKCKLEWSHRDLMSTLELEKKISKGHVIQKDREGIEQQLEKTEDDFQMKYDRHLEILKELHNCLTKVLKL